MFFIKRAFHRDCQHRLLDPGKIQTYNLCIIKRPHTEYEILLAEFWVCVGGLQRLSAGCYYVAIYLEVQANGAYHFNE